MDSTAIFIQHDFRCSVCGKRVPQIVLAVNQDKTICNDCDKSLFLKTYCSNSTKEEEITLRILEVTETQIKLLIAEIKKRVKSKSYEVVEIDDYWSTKTNNKYVLSDTGKKSIEKFLLDFTVEEIQQCIDIAFNKPTVTDEGRFKYLCGILNGKLKFQRYIW